MATTLIDLSSAPVRPVVAARAATDPSGGDWPRTSRVLPWGLALFIVVLWLVPFDNAKLPVTLPVDATLDRFLLVGLGGLWLCSLVVGGPGTPRVRLSSIHWALLGFVVIAVISLLTNLDRAALLAEDQLAFKRFATLLAYGAFFVLVSSTIRPSELRAFASLILGLAFVTALGTVYEYNADVNLFYDAARLYLPGAEIRDASGGSFAGRRVVIGPAQHGLAVTAMLAMALPLVVTRLIATRETGRRALLALGAILLVTGTLSTVRKTGAIAPIGALVVIAIYRPQAITGVLGLILAAYVAVALAAPQLLDSLRQQLFTGGFTQTDTTQGRLTDYPAVLPDILHHAVLGRGYGTYDVFAFRILDNQYLSLLVTVGVLGLAAFASILMATFSTAHPVLRSSDATRSQVALAAVSAAFVFGLVCALFDAMAFPQVPYVFLLFAALIVVASQEEHRVSGTRVE